jgi:hypothetical protein
MHDRRFDEIFTRERLMHTDHCHQQTTASIKSAPPVCDVEPAPLHVALAETVDELQNALAILRGKLVPVLKPWPIGDATFKDGSARAPMRSTVDRLRDLVEDLKATNRALEF